MPDAQTVNSVLSAYGISNAIGMSNGGGGFNWWNILSGIIFGIIGWYAFIHGKREKSMRPMVIGIILMVYPYFVPNALLALAIGLALCATLYFWRE